MSPPKVKRAQKATIVTVHEGLDVVDLLRIHDNFFVAPSSNVVCLDI